MSKSKNAAVSSRKASAKNDAVKAAVWDAQPNRPVLCTIAALCIPIRDVTDEDLALMKVSTQAVVAPMVQAGIALTQEALEMLEKKFPGVKVLSSVQEQAPNTGLPVGVCTSTGQWLAGKTPADIATACERLLHPAPAPQPTVTATTATAAQPAAQPAKGKGKASKAAPAPVVEEVSADPADYADFSDDDIRGLAKDYKVALKGKKLDRAIAIPLIAAAINAANAAQAAA